MRKTWQGMPTSADIHGDKWNQVADHVNDNFLSYRHGTLYFRICTT